tara:strand:- start:581 stop:1093 length:513 start_codon:yes stop_codon:yes gene_type:complete
MFKLLKNAWEKIKDVIVHDDTKEIKTDLEDRGYEEVEVEKNEIRFSSDKPKEEIEEDLEEIFQYDEDDDEDPIIHVYEYQTNDEHGFYSGTVCNACRDTYASYGGREWELAVVGGEIQQGYDEDTLAELWTEIADADSYEENLPCNLHHSLKGGHKDDPCQCRLIYKGTR